MAVELLVGEDVVVTDEVELLVVDDVGVVVAVEV